MKTRVKWVENCLFVGESGSGHSIVIDGPPEAGGRNLGIRPMETVLLGLGSCTASDVVEILRKKRQAVRDCVVEVDADRSDSVPKVFQKIHIRYLVTGKGLEETAVKHAVELSAEKYCSVSVMLGKTATISHEYEILEAD